VDDTPGVTRDRHYGRASWNESGSWLVDTGGFADDDEFSRKSSSNFSGHRRSGRRSARPGRKAGLSPYDRELLDTLRGIRKPVFYLVNKIDGLEHEGRLEISTGWGSSRSTRCRPSTATV